MKTKFLSFLLIIILLTGCSGFFIKEEETYRNSKYYVNGKAYKSSTLYDSNYDTMIEVSENDVIKLHNDKDFRYLYIVYEYNGTKAKISYNSKEKEIGTNGIIHEFVDLEENTNDIEFTYLEDAKVNEIYVFNEKDQIPWWVQKWEPSYDKADLLLIPAHADDEHLFFAGLIPTYVDRGYKVQIAYLTYHSNKPLRYHELLDGLWYAGVDHYPVLGGIPDVHSKYLDVALDNLKQDDLTEDDVIKYQVSLIRRFHPEVVVTHSIEGEYGHGQHRLSNYILKKAVAVSDNSKYYNDIPYETWKPKKVYFHADMPGYLYLDIDVALENFNGRSAFGVSQGAFRFHQSQHTGWVYQWIYGNEGEITKSSEIKTYRPNYYDLYYSSVGEDVERNDLFEHIKTASV